MSELIQLTDEQISIIDNMLKNMFNFNGNKTKVYLFRNLQKKLGFETGTQEIGNGCCKVTKPEFKHFLEKEIWEMIHGNGLEISRFLIFLEVYLPVSKLDKGIVFTHNQQNVLIDILNALLYAKHEYSEADYNNYGYSFFFMWSGFSFNKTIGLNLIKRLRFWLTRPLAIADNDLFNIFGLTNQEGGIYINKNPLTVSDLIKTERVGDGYGGVLVNMNIYDLTLFKFIGDGDIDRNIDYILAYLDFYRGSPWMTYANKWHYMSGIEEFIFGSMHIDLDLLSELKQSYLDSRPVIKDRNEPYIDESLFEDDGF